MRVVDAGPGHGRGLLSGRPLIGEPAPAHRRKQYADAPHSPRPDGPRRPHPSPGRDLSSPRGRAGEGRAPGNGQLVIAAFLGIPGESQVSQGSRIGPQANIYLPWEASYKSRALGPITSEGIDGWREGLTPKQAAQVVAICRHEMRGLGMEGSPSKIHGIIQTTHLPVATQARRLHDWAFLRRRQFWIDRIKL
jgi:hypothetical protein